MKKLIHNYSPLLSIIWALTIFCLCATPGKYIPSVNWLELLSFDKLVHATMFYILCTLLFITKIKYQQTQQWLVIYFIICVLYGGLLEVMQATYFSNRSGDWLDFIANSFGCLIALATFNKLNKLFETIRV